MSCYSPCTLTLPPCKNSWFLDCIVFLNSSHRSLINKCKKQLDFYANMITIFQICICSSVLRVSVCYYLLWHLLATSRQSHNWYQETVIKREHIRQAIHLQWPQCAAVEIMGPTVMEKDSQSLRGTHTDCWRTVSRGGTFFVLSHWRNHLRFQADFIPS